MVERIRQCWTRPDRLPGEGPRQSPGPAGWPFPQPVWQRAQGGPELQPGPPGVDATCGHTSLRLLLAPAQRFHTS